MNCLICDNKIDVEFECLGCRQKIACTYCLRKIKNRVCPNCRHPYKLLTGIQEQRVIIKGHNYGVFDIDYNIRSRENIKELTDLIEFTGFFRYVYEDVDDATHWNNSVLKYRSNGKTFLRDIARFLKSLSSLNNGTQGKEIVELDDRIQSHVTRSCQKGSRYFCVRDFHDNKYSLCTSKMFVTITGSKIRTFYGFSSRYYG